MPTVTAARTRLLAVVLVGGVFGSVLRIAAVAVLPGHAFPWPTLFVNGFGCAFVGAVLPLLRRDGVHPIVLPAAVAGIGGAFTTFATFASEVVGLAADGRVALGATYLAASLLLGIGAVVAGSRLGRRIR